MTRRPGRTARRPPGPAAPLPLRHPAMMSAALATALLIALGVTTKIVDTDFWQHLAVGRAIWTLKQVPHTNVWTWSTYGAPYVVPSWGFRALLWPFYAAGGVTGLYVWRWLTTLAAFALAWAAARRMGAVGFAPLAALALCAVVYRQRTQVRPETLVAVLIALEIFLLEARRRAPAATDAVASPRGRDPSPWLVAVAWVWANVHISYYIGLALIAIHIAAQWIERRPAAAAARRGWPLAVVLIAALAASFLNPFGWRALAQPFEYFFVWRHELIYQGIDELGPIHWRATLTDGVALLLAAWPLLALWRARRRGPDWAEGGTLLLFEGIALTGKRFLGPLAIAAAPYLARDLDDWVRARAWPAWSTPPWHRAGFALAAGLAVTPLGWQYVDLRPAFGVSPWFPPRAACDWIATHGVGGRDYNSFELGGYVLWRFWPDASRLPFIDIHQTGTRTDRFDVAMSSLDDQAWRRLDQRHRFEWVLLKRLHDPRDHALDFVEADSTWGLVFADDAAALFLKRDGAHAALMDSFAYRLAPAGAARRGRLAAACLDDSLLRGRAEAELERMAGSSPESSQALSLLASLLVLDQRWADARATLERAHQINASLPLYRERLAEIEQALAGR